MTKPAVQFYLSMKFNPSPHVLKMRGLYDSRREMVRGSENAHLVWVSDGDFDEGAAKRVRERFGGVKMCLLVTPVPGPVPVPVPTKTCVIALAQRTFTSPGPWPLNTMYLRFILLKSHQSFVFDFH